MKKRILSMLLTIVMVIGMFPTAAFAAAADNLCEHHAEHTAECGYMEGVSDCAYHCDVCLGHDHDSEEASEAVCDCGTDDAAIHATTCAVYVAPENPVCYCAEKCSDVNEWCDICGFDYTACGGTDAAAAYAEGTIDLSQYSEGATIDISEDCKIIGDGNAYNIALNITENATVTFDIGTSGVKLGAPITVADGKTLTLLVAGDAEHTVNGGISLGNGSNVIIEGDLTKENNKLTVTATGGNAGIGANNGVTAGNVTIRNARVDATGSSKEVSADSNMIIRADTSISGAAIGTSDGSMGDILIENSIIVAEGGYYENTSHAPAIGIGYVGSTMGNITLKDSQITAANNGDGLASVIGAGANHHVFVSGSLGDIVITNTELNLSMAVSTKNWYAAVIGSGIGFSHGYVNMGKIIFTDVTQAELDEMIPTWLPSDFNESQGYALGRGNDGSIYKYDAFGGVWVSDGNGGTVQIGDESGYYINCNKSGFVHDFDEICGGTCSDCGVTYLVVHTMGTAATCSAKAVCSVCGESYGDIDADAHSYGDWVSNGDNTHTRTCANDNTHTDDGDCSGGTATCTTLAVCENCGASYGEVGGHSPDAAGYTVNADGTHSYTCSSCGNPFTESHTFTDGACTGCGVIGGYCGEEGNEQNVIWTYANGTLTISGTGAMADQFDNYNNRPWEEYVDQITTIVVNDGITSIGEAAFGRFQKLTTAKLPDSLTTISQQAFYGCTALKTVNFPANLKTIEGWAFLGCALESVTLPEGLTTIGYRAFSECKNLTSVTVPASVTTIDEGAFGYSPAKITVAEDNLNYSSDEHGVLFDKDKTTLIYCRPNIEVETYTIPSTVTEICKEAFYGCKNLATITIPDGVQKIGSSAFGSCEALTTITIPAGVTTIEANTFYDCTALTAVTIPAGVTTIDMWAFSGCTALTTVTIPASVTSIAYNAFSNCSALTTVNVPCTWDGSLYTFDESVTLNKVHNWVDGTCTACGVPCDHTDSTHTAATDNGDGTHSFECSVCVNTVIEDHTATYSESGNVITESCSKCKATIGTATISATGKTYDGNAVEVVVSKTGSLENTDIPVTLTKGGEAFTGEPVNAGTYTASITLGESENTATASVDFAIAKAAVSIATAPTPNTLTYIGEAQYLINPGEAVGGTMVYSLTEDGEHTTSIPQGTNAGEYTVWYYVQGDANYNDSAKDSVAVSIAKAPLTVTADAKIKSYGDENPTLTYTAEGLLGGDTLTSALTGALSREEGENVGSYAITLGTLSADNYTISFEEADFTIQAKEVTDPIVTLEQDSYVYNGTAKEPEVTSIIVDGVKLTEDVDYRVLSYERNIYVGEAEVVIHFMGNYRGSLSRFFQITKAPLTVTAESKTMTTGQNLPTFTYTITGFVGGETEDVLTAKPTVSCEADGKTAGTYDITVSGAAADNYEITHVNGTLTVADHQHAWTYTAKDDTITATCNAEGCPDAEQSITISAVGKTYDGTPVTATLTGSIDDVATPEITYTGNINAGTHTASITIEGKTASVKFTIEKATVTVTADAKSKPYGTDNPTLTYTSEGLLGDDVLTGALETTATKTSNVGEYDITVGSLANSNYTISFVGAKLTITKAAAPAIAWPTAAELTYGQPLSASTLTSQDENGTFAWQDGSIVPTVTNNGYVIVYTPKDTDNYDYTVVELTETIPVTVSKVSATVTVAPTPNTLTYTGEAQYLISAGEANGGTMQYSTDNQTWSTTIPQGTDAGKYTVYYKVVGDANHSDTAVGSVGVTIAKADPSYTVPTGLTATYGELLSSVVLPAGFAWTDGGQTVGNVGNNTFTATYTPSDTVNYKVVESISVSVVVGKAASGCETPEAVSGLSFNGGNQNLITAGTATGGTMQYSLDGSNWSETIPSGKDAKTYTVYYKVVGNSNHNDSSVDSVQVTIGKATLTVTADNKTMTTGQNLPTFTYTITGFVHGETEDVLTTKPTVSCEANGQTAGTYDITVSGAAADNYEITHVNGTLTVADHQHAWTYTAKDDTITATCNAEGCPDAEQSITISAVGKTYDGTPVTATLTGSIDDVATPEITYTGNINAGTHTASITIEGKTASVKFTIEKATVTVTAGAKSKTYGTDNPTLTYTSEGLLGDDALTGALETTATKTSNVGEYDITVGSLANSNYTIDFVGAKLTITKAAAPEIQWPTAAALTYGQKLSDSALTSEDKNGTFAWQDGSIVPTVTNDGYVVVYTPKDTDNYDYTVVELTETIPVTVSKGQATVTAAPTPNTLTYTGTAQNLVNAGSANGGTMVYSLSENGQYTETIPTGTNAGEYTVWYYVDGDDNHSDSAKASVEVTIAKAKAVINVDTTPINVAYGEEVTLPTATTSFGQVSCDKTATDLVNAGTYTVTYSVAGTDNYEGAEKTLAVTVGQKSVAEPTVTGTYTYTGAEQTVVLTGVESYMTVASGNKGTNAGNYEVEITLNSNYKWADDSDGKVQWSIAKAQAEIRVNTDPITVTYGETVKLPTATTNFGNVVCSKTADDLVNAGTYTVAYTVAGTDNYAGNTKTLTVTVGQKTVTEPAITGTYTYTGAEQTVVLTGVESCMTIVSGNKGTDVDNYEVEVTLDGNHKWAEGSDGKVQWSIIKAQAEISVNTDPITVIYGEKVTLPAATTNFGTVSCNKTTADLVNVGSYTVTYTVAGTANYAGDTETVTVTINPKAITADDVELKGTLTYNGSEQIQQITGKNGITCDVTGNKANDVGTYELTVTGTGNYTGEVKLSYTVAKKPISVVWENTNLVYNGSAQSPVAKLAGVVTDDDVQAVVNGNGTNAGTYDATVSLTGTDADNYALTGSTKFTIARAPVTFKVSNNSVKEGKAIAVTVISEPAGVGHTVTYRQNGDVVTPSAVGEYDIYVEITDSNYRHAASANGNAIKIGVLTIYEGKKPATYTLSYAPGEGSGTIAAEEAALAGTIRILPECTFTAPKDSNNNDMLFVGWTDGNATYKAGEQYRQPEKNVTMTALWVVEEHNISGMVKQFVSLDSTDLVKRGGVVVTLMLGSKQVAQAVTDANGNYKFEHCLLGTYNLVAEYEGIRQTAKAVLGHSDMSDLEIYLPAGKTNSTVDVEPGTPDVVVGGLDEMMKTTDDKVFTEEDKKVVEQGGEVEIKMEVKENPAPEKKDDLEKKAEEISTVTEIGIFIDLDLTKTVTEAAETTGTTTTIAEASKLLENIIFLPGHIQGKNAYHVFREHGGKIEEMTELHAVPTGNNEGFIVDRVNHTITIYSMKYSTYAIAYTDSFTITFNANGGKVDVESAITGTDGTLESLPTPTRSGYTFKGWFTTESGGTEVTTDTVFNADKIIYAQWTMNYVPTPSGGSTNKITVSTALNGKVSADLSNAKEGTTVTITVEPDDGYELDELLVSDASGNELKVTANGNNKYSFVMPDSKVTIKATFVPEREECTGGDSCLSAQFSDLDPSLWYHEATDYVLENGLMNGVGGGKFDPKGTTSRAMIVTILWRLEGEPVVNYLMQFGDVAAESWYTEAVRWAASEKIVEGWNGKFDPMGEITREQFATILWRYAKYKDYDVSVGEDTNILSYEDAFSISEYAIPAMQWACGAGLMQGDGVNLTPKADATRAQAAALFQRFCENVAEK